MQLLLTAVLVLGQKWFSAAVHAAVLAYLVQLYVKKQVFMEAADAFRQLGKLKQWRFTVFVVYCLSFVFVTYRWASEGDAPQACFAEGSGILWASKGCARGLFCLPHSFGVVTYMQAWGGCAQSCTCDNGTVSGICICAAGSARPLNVITLQAG